MAADPAKEDLTYNFGLQLLLEGHHQAGLKPAAPAEAAVFDHLLGEMLSQSLTVKENDPMATHITASQEHNGRSLISRSHAEGQISFHLDRNYQGFCRAARHYLYYVDVLQSSVAVNEKGSDVVLVIAARFPWLVSALSPGLLWVSTAFSFAKYT